MCRPWATNIKRIFWVYKYSVPNGTQGRVPSGKAQHDHAFSAGASRVELQTGVRPEGPRCSSPDRQVGVHVLGNRRGPKDRHDPVGPSGLNYPYENAHPDLTVGAISCRRSAPQVHTRQRQAIVNTLIANCRIASGLTPAVLCLPQKLARIIVSQYWERGRPRPHSARSATIVRAFRFLKTCACCARVCGRGRPRSQC